MGLFKFEIGDKLQAKTPLDVTYTVIDSIDDNKGGLYVLEWTDPFRDTRQQKAISRETVEKHFEGVDKTKRMKVKDLIKELADHNMDADVEIIVDGMPQDYEMNIGSSEGVQKHNAEKVLFCVDTPEENES